MARLLSLNNYHYRRGGSDVVYFEHDALFRARGWDTAVMAMRHPQNVPSPWSEHFVEEIEYDHAVSPWQRLKQAGKVVWSSEAVRRIDALLDRFPADVVHAHCVYHHLSPSVLHAAHRRGIPVVMTQHDLKLACPAYKMLDGQGAVCERCRGGNVSHVLANRCIRGSRAASAVVMVESALHRAMRVYPRSVDRLVAPSRFYVEKLVEWGWDRSRLRYVPNYVHASRFAPEYAPGDYVLYFGRLAPEKGLPTLLRAAARADVSLVVAGTGPQERALREEAESLGVRASFVGYRSGAALHALVRGARAVVLPSEWYENAPMSVLESFAMGKPVVGARIGGIPELIEDGRTGVVFRSGDVDDLARALREVVDARDATLESMGREARRYVETTFTEERYFREICDVYAELGVTLPQAVPA